MSRLTTVDDRFFAKVHMTDGCWLWRGSHAVEGYGQISVNGRKVRAHRFAYEQVIGAIPAGLDLDHLCRNPACVRPDHLEPVTRCENLLRGDTFQARNAAKTHCPQGHPYDESNTYRNRGRRYCWTCLRLTKTRAKAS